MCTATQPYPGAPHGSEFARGVVLMEISMRPRLSRLLFSVALAGLLIAASPVRAQDDQQSLGDVAKKNRAAKPKAKVTLDEDNSSRPAPASSPAAASDNSATTGQTT